MGRAGIRAGRTEEGGRCPVNIPLNSPLARKILADIDHPRGTPGDCRPQRKRTTAAVTTTAPLAWSVSFTVPVTVVSEANRREHWTVKHNRVKSQGKAVAAAIAVQGLRKWKPPSWPVVVTLARLGGPRTDDDNSNNGLKAVRDAVAAFLAVDDGDETKVRWEYPPATKQDTPAVGVTISGTV